MKCENCFCIYEVDGNCSLDSVELDIIGQCKSCIYITVDRQLLEESKIKTINKIQK